MELRQPPPHRPHHVDGLDQRSGGGLFLTKPPVSVSFLFFQVSRGNALSRRPDCVLNTWINPTEFACRMGVRTRKCSQPAVGAWRSPGPLLRPRDSSELPSSSAPSTINAARRREKRGSPRLHPARPLQDQPSQARAPHPHPVPGVPPTREHPSRAAPSLPCPPQAQTPAPEPLGRVPAPPWWWGAVSTACEHQPEAPLVKEAPSPRPHPESQPPSRPLSGTAVGFWWVSA